MVVAIGQLYAGNIFYVKQNSQGSGSSWTNAFGSVQQALEVAQRGDAIWVAKGSYTTTSGADRSLYFQIKDGVKLYGGFAGHERSLTQRNINANRTILSGEIGSPSNEDNAYTVIYTENVSSATVIDGFIITGGSADVEEEQSNASLLASGAGWYNVAKGKNSSPTIRNCQFIENKARQGAGLFNLALDGECNPIIEDCAFIQNSADLSGGGIYNATLSAQSKAAPKLNNVRFEYNKATYGSGIMNKAEGGKVTPLVQNCQFTSNRAYIRGAGVYNDFAGNGTSRAIMIGCVLQNNISSVGDAVSSRAGSYSNKASYGNSGLR